MGPTMSTPQPTAKRVTLVGPRGCGKTAFCLRLQHAPVDPNKTPHRVDPFALTWTVGGRSFGLAIHDTCEQDPVVVEHDALGNITLFCYAVDDHRSFEVAGEMFKRLNTSPVPASCYPVGMKADLRADPSRPGLVSRDEAKRFVDTYCLRNYMECSSRSAQTDQPANVIATVAFDAFGASTLPAGRPSDGDLFPLV